ncbi:MAG TPA: colicin D domain-containing protein [Jatrophihabitans sp.]|nr:colicin D domain-containing protein [Jatrophihabitans sp.]
MTGLLELETDDFADASRSLYWDVGDPLSDAASRLTSRLQESGGMAGTDPAGRDWAASYDGAAAAVIGATQDAVNACYKLAAMFAQTARNYAAADAASTAGGRHDATAATPSLPPDSTVSLPTRVPTAEGATGGPPAHWGLIGGLVGYVWPDGHQDRLRAAAGAWRSCGQTLWWRSEYVAVAAVPALGDRLPEFADMSAVCTSMYQHLREVAHAQLAMADACDELAQHLDEMHSEVEHELWSLVEWTAVIETTGAVASVFTVGLAEAPTQAVEAARIARTAAKVGELIQKFMVLARGAAQSIAATAQRASAAAGRLRAVLDTRLTAAPVQLADRFPALARLQERVAAVRPNGDAGPVALPRFRTSLPQVEKKFGKHSADFGVTAARGREGFEAFAQALRAFVGRTSVTRVRGYNRGREAVLSFDSSSRLIVIQHPDGSFWTCYRMTQAQLQRVVETGRIGLD